MTIQTMPARMGEFLIGEADNTLSREAVVIAAGAGSLTPGSVLGRITKRQAAAPIPAVAGGTGNGTMSLLTFGPDVQVGSYVIQCTAAVAHGGVFSVTAPDGTALPSFSMGTTTGGSARYTSSHLSFTLTDNTDFITANSFTVVVTAGGTPVVVGGTGTGTCTAITLGKLAELGTYKVINRVAVAEGGDFDVISPRGAVIGRFLMGTTSTGAVSFTSDHVNFTLTDATDFILGNYFNIIVAGYTAPEAVLWDPTAVNGANEAWGVLLAAADATSAAQNAVAIVRNAEVFTNKLAWKSTVTAAQKAEAYRQLSARNVIAR
ncbi:head decoration protein [uncultured Lamprocystis sp.]|jgi:hypothetical protein|uniref:head decoration protein n=1 Tax=uncultured Lamprocystis sp. TaxID=543132 RepID=UPI0025F4D5A6|nr:head decoration protein [uncultured Lamprocystis sp.]